MTSPPSAPAKPKKREPSRSISPTRGRSPGPRDDDSIDAPNNQRGSKRKKRSELSPQTKASHSNIEKERREAMNERFSELANMVPELRIQMEGGKKPTKGDIVKASISRHREQEALIDQLKGELCSIKTRYGIPQSEASPQADNAEWLGKMLLEQANSEQAETEAASTPHTEVTVASTSSAFKDTVIAPTEWNVSPVQDWLAADNGGSMLSIDVPKEIQATMIEFAKEHLQQPISAYSSPTFATWHSDSGEPSLISQRSHSDSFDVEAFAFLSNQLPPTEYTYQSDIKSDDEGDFLSTSFDFEKSSIEDDAAKAFPTLLKAEQQC